MSSIVIIGNTLLRNMKINISIENASKQGTSFKVNKKHLKLTTKTHKERNKMTH